MYTKSLAVAVVAIALAGCTSNVQTNNPGPSDDAHLAAFAANTNYPTTQPQIDQSKLTVGALIPPNSDSIQIVNYSDQAVNPSNVWINGAYVQHVETIPPHGVIALKKSDFYSKSGDVLTSSGVTINQVQIEVDGQLYNALGPVSTTIGG